MLKERRKKKTKEKSIDFESISKFSKIGKSQFEAEQKFIENLNNYEMKIVCLSQTQKKNLYLSDFSDKYVKIIHFKKKKNKND